MDFSVNCSIYTITDGEIISIKLDDAIFDKRQNIETKLDVPKETYKHHIKESYIKKYVKANNVGLVFKIDDFLRMYPKQKHNKQLKHNIACLIEKGFIQQWTNKDEFRIIKKIE